MKNFEIKRQKVPILNEIPRSAPVCTQLFCNRCVL